MRLTVIIPCLNAAASIERALRSVFAQTLEDYEVVLVDDGSTDGTTGLALRAAPEAVASGRLRVVTQQNRGAAAARNRGMAEARGEAVAFLDADDYWEPQYLQEMAAVLARFPSAGAVLSNSRVVTTDRTWVACTYRTQEPVLIADFFRTRARNSIVSNTSAVVLRRETIERVGPMREDLRRSQDTEYWARIAAHGIAWAYSPLPLAYFDQTGEHSLSRSRSGPWYERIPLPELWSRDIWPLLQPDMVPGFTDLYLMRTRYLCALFLREGVGTMAKAAAREALPRTARRPLDRLQLRFISTMPPRLTW